MVTENTELRIQELQEETENVKYRTSDTGTAGRNKK